MLSTTGAVGAAKAAGVAAGAYAGIEEAMHGGEIIREIEPEKDLTEYLNAFQRWNALR